MRRLLVSIWFANMVLTGAVWATAPDIIDGVAAVVNDKIITYSEIRDYVQPVVAQMRRNYSDDELVAKIKAAQMDALNNLVERNLILQDFKTKGMSIPESLVDGEMNEIIASDFSGDRAAFIKTLEAENTTLKRYRDQLRDQIIIRAMRSRKTQNEVVVSPYKIETYYKKHLDDYKEDDQIKLRMIFIKKLQEPASDVAQSGPTIIVLTNTVIAAVTNQQNSATNAVVTLQTNVVVSALAIAEMTNTMITAVTNSVITAATNQESSVTNVMVALETNTVVSITTNTVAVPIDPRRRTADEILAKLEAGDSFDSLARVYSDGTEAKSGGDWGWVKRDELRKDLSDPAFKLKPGAHSPVIETPEGYYLLQVDEVKPAHNRPLVEVRDEIEKILLQQQRMKMQDDWVKQLRAKAYIRMF